MPPKTIDEAANNLAASLKREQEQALALDIQDHVLRIFEACNFQDLTGQRIAKVLADAEIHRGAHRAHDGNLGRPRRVQGLHRHGRRPSATSAVTLHGPKLDGDEGHASQDDVDVMFAIG